MIHKIETDVLIVGGGIAGLWMLRRLLSLGVDALLIETDRLGGGQTMKSQGIVHGGMKYTLAGCLTSASESIACMPERWLQCLNGEGDVDLSSAVVLSDSQHIWCPGGFQSRLLGFFASRSLRSRISELHGDQIPIAFSDPSFEGTVYRLNEFVLDVPSVVQSLADAVHDRVLKVDSSALQSDIPGGKVRSLQCWSDNKLCKINAKSYVLTAGKGNARLLEQWGRDKPAMQCRPLHMVMVRHRYPNPLYAHCLTMATVPRLTISSHPLGNGEWLWYLGGALAETGVNKDAAHQVEAAKAELRELLPWVNLSGAEWSTLRVDRAEPANRNKLRPDTSFCESIHNVLVTWPTKLALAPQLTDVILAQLETLGVIGDTQGTTLSVKLPDFLGPPQIAAPAWRGSFA